MIIWSSWADFLRKLSSWSLLRSFYYFYSLVILSFNFDFVSYSLAIYLFCLSIFS